MLLFRSQRSSKQNSGKDILEERHGLSLRRQPWRNQHSLFWSSSDDIRQWAKPVSFLLARPRHNRIAVDPREVARPKLWLRCYCHIWPSLSSHLVLPRHRRGHGTMRSKPVDELLRHSQLLHQSWLERHPSFPQQAWSPPQRIRSDHVQRTRHCALQTRITWQARQVF